MSGKRKSRRKYEQGDRITSLDEMYDQELIFVMHKVYAKGWFQSWPMRFAKLYLDHGMYKVVPIRKEGDGQNERQNEDRVV